MDILRTPDSRFDGLPDYPFAAHYHEVAAGLRMHFIDEGPRQAGTTVVMLHGEPSWSYLYRNMISKVSAAGIRVVAPDLIGFGKSDKPAARGDYSIERHLQWLTSLLIDHLQLRDITLVGQDWGSTLGLRLAVAHPGRFDRIIIGNGMLLSWMMFRTGMVPRRLAQLGLIAGPALMAASLGILFGVLDHNDAPYVIGVVPEFFWELLLGIYLTVTGGRMEGRLQ